jgi:hypothetical protein
LTVDKRWKLRQFFSVDIIGSTELKRNADTDERVPSSSLWSVVFAEFFREFPQILRESYDVPSVLTFGEQTRPPTPWRFAGDEILLEVELEKHTESLQHLLAVRHALAESNRRWAEKGRELRLKATSWLGGFPVTNIEISLPGRDHSIILDFIGPSIDTGFRLAKFATERKFIISADLALMVLHASDTCRTTLSKQDLRLRLDGRVELKGVLGGIPYPIIWIDLGQDWERKGDELLTQLSGLPCAETWKEFLQGFIDQTEGLNHVFIEKDPDPNYGSVPEEFEEMREKLESESTLRGYVNQGESTDPATPNDLPEDPIKIDP